MAKKARLAPWLRQPVGPAGINRAHPRADGLVFFAPLSGAHGTLDLARGQLGARTALEDVVPTQSGALHSAFLSGNYLDFPEVPPEIGATTPFTVAWTQEPRSPAAYSTVMAVNFGTPGVNTQFVIYQSVSDSGYYFTAGTNGTTPGWNAAIGPLTDGRLDRFVLRAAGGSQSNTTADYSLYRNGVLIAQDASSALGLGTAAAFRFGALGTGDPFEGLIGDVRLWSRVLSAEEAEAESTIVGSYALYAPRRIFVPVSAGGGATNLVVADAAHSHAADNLVLTSSTALTIADATHAHAADNLVLTSSTALTIADAAHAHAADNVVLTSAHLLTIADALHSHAADNLALTLATALTVADATHAHAADNLTLSVLSVLAVADALHAHAADNLVLEVSGTTNLVIADATHSHAADNLVLTSAHLLTIADALHSHAADGLTLTVASVLAIQDALHAHAADNVVLLAGETLAIADALHAHTSDGLALTVTAYLVVADARHGHSAANLVLTLPGQAVGDANWVIRVALDDHLMYVAADDALMIVQP